MDRDTALVSPQFHVAYDANFDTVGNIKTILTWQLRAGFVTAQKEPARRDATTPPKQLASMAASGKKRKRHTSDEIRKAGNPEPSRQTKEPAAANVEDDSPPIPIDTTTRVTEYWGVCQTEDKIRTQSQASPKNTTRSDVHGDP